MKYIFIILEITLTSVILSASLLAQDQPFITKWKTDNEGSSCDSCIEIPIEGMGYGYDVDWENDGIFDEYFSGPATHDYGVPGEYTVAIKGNFPRIYFNDWNGAKESFKLIEIIQWGDIKWETFRKAFMGCELLQITATDAPNLTNVTDLSDMFSGAKILNSDLDHWDVSNITNMSSMFNYCMSFDAPIGSWDVSNVQDMSGMFVRAKAFNQDISNWDVSSVTTMEEMFKITEAFNAPIGNWDVSNVVNMRSMFEESRVFNQPLNDWQTSSLQVMFTMFKRAFMFNQDLTNWDVSNVRDFSGLFEFASDFNGDISTWDVSQVDDMGNTFFFAISFNQEIGNWDVSNVEDMNGTFERAEIFNGDISAWDVSNVSIMVDMFSDAAEFNVDLSSWDVSNVIDMKDCFNNASSFDQSLGDWDLTSIIQSSTSQSLENMLDNCGMSALHYQSTLDGWANNPMTPNNVALGSEGLLFCDEESRNILIGKGWNIVGDKMVEDQLICVSSTESLGLNDVQISPIPCTEYVEIIDNSQYDKLAIVSVSGQVLLENDLVKGRNRIDLQNLNDGIYFIHLKNKYTTDVRRIIKN